MDFSKKNDFSKKINFQKIFDFPKIKCEISKKILTFQIFFWLFMKESTC